MEAFLKKFITKDGKEHTHTKIGSPKLNISGGSYCIPPTEMDNFYSIYKTHVFSEGKQAYLTEKQLAEAGIFYDQLIMGVGGGVRILINDNKPNGDLAARCINLERNMGIKDINIE